MNDTIKDPGYWRKRAVQTRTQAQNVRTSRAERQRLLRIADKYDHVARHAEADRKIVPIQIANFEVPGVKL